MNRISGFLLSAAMSIGGPVNARLPDIDSYDNLEAFIISDEITQRVEDIITSFCHSKGFVNNGEVFFREEDGAINFCSGTQEVSTGYSLGEVQLKSMTCGNAPTENFISAATIPGDVFCNLESQEDDNYGCLIIKESDIVGTIKSSCDSLFEELK